MRLLRFFENIFGNLSATLAITFLLLGPGLNCLQAQSGGEVASFYNSVNGIITNQGTVELGSQFTLTVGVTSPEEMKAATVSLHWDPELIQVAENGIVDAAGMNFDLLVENALYSGPGYLTFSKAAFNSTNPTGSIDFVSITFDVNPDITVNTTTIIQHVTVIIPEIEPEKNLLPSNIGGGSGSVLNPAPDAIPSFSLLIDVPISWDCPIIEANIGDVCDDENSLTQNDVITADCECVGTPIITWDCPIIEANIGDACDDENSLTENDVITADCECAGTPIITWDCPIIEANIGDACNDDNPLTENDVITTDCDCAGTPIITWDCPIIEANIGDTCDDGNPLTENDVITTDCECAGTPIITWDCPIIEANIGDACNDENPLTENDVITADCECAGTPIVTWDCPIIEANIGDACNDDNPLTENDVITADCECAGTPIVAEYDCPSFSANIGDPCELEVGMGILNSDCECIVTEIPSCEDFVYFLSDHAAADGIADIYGITLSGGTATMNYIATSDIEVHIAYKADEKLIYAISKHENSYRTLDPADASWGPETSLGGDYGEITAAVFNHDGKLLIGSQNHKVIYSVNLITNVVSTFDTYSPINGGDLAFASDGMLYMATRSGNGLYEVWSAPVVDNLIGILPAKVTGMAITDTDQLLISAHGNTSLVLRNSDGSDSGESFNLMLDGEAYTLRDGDMASGCNPAPPEIGYCPDFNTYLANHGTGISGSDIYKVSFTESGLANLTFLTNVTYETHIAFDAQSKILYLVNVDGSFVSVYDVSAKVFLSDVPILGDFDKLTAAVYNPNDNLIYVGDHVQNKIYTIDPLTGISAYYADAPVSGGDLEILDNGALYLGTKQGSALYEVVASGSAVLVGNMTPNVNGMARANDEANSFITSNKGANVFSKIAAVDGSTIKTYPIMLEGVPFTLSDGDMAAGCSSLGPSIETGGCYATQVIEYVQGTAFGGGAIATNRTNPNQALGAPERNDALVFVSLGYGGSLILAFDGAIPNGIGNDIEIVETSFGNPSCSAYPEYANVFVSVDGSSWYFAKTVCRTDGFVDISDAGDFAYVNYVKIVNENEMSTTPDGFDVDGVVALHNCIDVDVPPIHPFVGDESTSTLLSYPNPTQGPSKVVFVTGETTHALVEVYDMSGRKVGTVFDQEAQQDEKYTLDFNGSSLPNGVYIYRLTTNNETIIEKFMITR